MIKGVDVDDDEDEDVRGDALEVPCVSRSLNKTEVCIEGTLVGAKLGCVFVPCVLIRCILVIGIFWV